MALQWGSGNSGGGSGMGFSGSDWGNLLGLGGIPGSMQTAQNLMGNMFPQQQPMDFGEYDPQNLGELLSMMNRGQQQGGQTQQANYLSGGGFI